MTKMLARYVVEAAARETGISVEALKSKTRRAEIAYAKKILYRATPEMGITFSEMARYLGKDHSTLCQGIRNKRETVEERRIIEAIKLTAQFVARERTKRFRDALATGATL